MWLVFLLVILLLIGIFFSDVEVNLQKINILEKNYNFKIIISLKLFGILKILFIKLDKLGIKILNKKIKINKKNIKKIDKKSFDLLKDMNLKLTKVNFNIKVGLIDITLTNISIILLSSFIPFLLKGRIKRKKIKYQILPEYNKFYLYFNGNFAISIKLYKLIEFYFKNINLKIEHNKSKNYSVKESFKYE